MMKQIITSVKFLIVVTLITGILYPLLIAGIANLFFSEKARGSLVKRNEIVIGSALIGQNFENPEYFHGRPSAVEYNPIPSGASNLGPMNPVLENLVTSRKKKFLRENLLADTTHLFPEMLFSSASGLDPHISPESAMIQVERIAKARGFDQAEKLKLVDLIKNMSEIRQFSLLGEPRINVFLLNLKTDSLK
ncbi:MAG: potassium-transporting ATPase KdpC subunit [Bacteroidota bacterium]|nr:potassium-transporting ATPase KdpC subunit [Bacteroidota bacterium]